MLYHLQFIFQHDRIKVFFFMPCLCTSSSESLQLTISWTNSAQSTSFLAYTLNNTQCK